LIGLMFGIAGQESFAGVQFVTGRVAITQGHQNPSCRTVSIVDATGNSFPFRIPTPNGPDSIAAELLAAQVAQLSVTIAFDPAITSGCGTEPAIQYVSVNSP
jgi:hypothetical protein